MSAACVSIIKIRGGLVSTSNSVPPLTPLSRRARTRLARAPSAPPLRRLHISLTGVAGQMALDFVAYADGQSVVFSGPSAAPTTIAANCTQQ